MPKFIRTEYGHIYEYIEQRIYPSQYLKFGLYRDNPKSDYEGIVKVSDTIEELFMPNDLLIVGDDKNQMPIFIESIEYLRAWLYCHDIYKIKEFYIKNGNDFKCVAKMNDKGDLELI